MGGLPCEPKGLSLSGAVVLVLAVSLLIGLPLVAEAAVCGNTLVELGEECDDGNLSNLDSCLDDCTLNVCGDGFPNVEPWSPATTTTTFSPATTSTTLPTDICDWELSLRLDDAVTFGSLTFTLDYSTASGEMVGVGSDVQCAMTTDALLAGVGLSAFNDDESNRIITAGFLSTGGGTGPVDLAACVFAGSRPVSGDFAVVVTEAVAPDFTALSPIPSVSIVVGAALPNSCGTSTTTTVAPATTTSTSTSTTTTTVPAGPPPLIGALTVTLDFTGGATISTCGASLDALLGPAPSVATGIAGTVATIGTIDAEGIDASAGLEYVWCSATGASVAGNYVLNITEATDTAFADISGNVAVVVSSTTGGCHPSADADDVCLTVTTTNP